MTKIKVNPYENILNLIREEGSKYNPPFIKTGTVVSIDPICIKIGDLQLTKGNLLINSNLLEHKTIIDGTSRNIDKSLKAGDVIAAVGIEELQTYIVLCKVV